MKKAIIVDATGTTLNAEERALFSAEKPAGFILFRRNCETRDQIRKLVDEVRRVVDDEDLPVLIDQEGGEVARLRAPQFTEYPAARTFWQIAAQDVAAARDAARMNNFLMALDLADMGITVNCAPVVDVPSATCHPFLAATRVYHDDADTVGLLGESVARGLLTGGVTPVVKHIPGHGRATVDSHFDLPVVTAGNEDLAKTDFKPFKYLAETDMHRGLWAMAAHVVYSALDPDSAATLSARIVDDVIRGYMGFDGVLLADDISMKALGGTLAERVTGTLAAGMDLTMICNASFDDRAASLAATPAVTDAAAKRIAAAETIRKTVVANGKDNKETIKEQLAGIYERYRNKV